MKTLLQILENIKEQGLDNPTLTMNALNHAIDVHRQNYTSHEDMIEEAVWKKLTEKSLEIYSPEDDGVFCRVEWCFELGDSSVGIDDTSVWVLSDDQSGTELEKMRHELVGYKEKVGEGL